jgi:hypothetical protein
MWNRYIIDFTRVVILLLPFVLAMPEMIAWLGCLLMPLAWVHQYVFKPFVDDYIFRASITSSVCRLEYMLNYTFFQNGLANVNYNRRIRIEPLTYQNGLYVYLGDGGSTASSGGIDGQPIEENAAIPISLTQENAPVFLYTANEVGAYGGVDYIVKVPQPEAGNINLTRLKAMLNSNQLPDKSYQIINY